MINKELECIEEIINTIKKYNIDFDEEKARNKIEKIKAKKNPLWVIKRVNGILKNSNSENAKQKIEALKKFLIKE